MSMSNTLCPFVITFVSSAIMVCVPYSSVFLVKDQDGSGDWSEAAGDSDQSFNYVVFRTQYGFLLSTLKDRDIPIIVESGKKIKGRFLRKEKKKRFFMYPWLRWHT